MLRSPFLVAAILSGTAAFFCFQRALQTNRPLTAIAVMEAGAVAGGVLAGFIAFGDSLGGEPGDGRGPRLCLHRGRCRRVEPRTGSGQAGRLADRGTARIQR